MRHILGLTFEQLGGWLTEHELPGYRAHQIWQWIYGRRAASFDEMTDLPKALRAQLAEEFHVFASRVVACQQAGDGTEKLLLELRDGERIECVLLRDDRQHRTVCVSTQVGCGMGCAFCATGLDGVVRNLASAEIIEQMLQLQRLLGPCGKPVSRAVGAGRRRSQRGKPSAASSAAGQVERLSHVVVMGMGEPLANLDALLSALSIATSASGLGIGARRITISTVGLPKGIRRLAEQHAPYHLAVSLHAADDRLRNELVPANRQVGIGSILEATDEYFGKTGRRVTFEYVLLADINDQPDQARRLVALLRHRPALLNLIPYNPVRDLPYRTPSPAATACFAQILTQGGLTVKVRYRKGERIEAACGQLRRRNG